MSTTYAIAVGLADIHRAPTVSSELVTQALLNTPAIVGESHGEWTLVTLPDYQGWVASDTLEEPIKKGFTKIGEHCATPLALSAVVTTTHAPLYTSMAGNEQLDTVYLSTLLPLLDSTHPGYVQVALPGERTGWLAREAVAIRQQQEAYPISGGETALAHARAFLGVPYLWGGTSWCGIDCSGLVQVCYRMAGHQLPRDADQQYDALHGVERDVTRTQMRAGDLLFFGPEQAITHVALALNATEFIHAEGNRFERVLIHSLDKQAANYDARLDSLLLYSKRVVL